MIHKLYYFFMKRVACREKGKKTGLAIVVNKDRLEGTKRNNRDFVTAIDDGNVEQSKQAGSVS